MARPLWMLCGVAMLAIGLAAARPGAADNPGPAPSPQNFAFLEVGKTYNIFLSGNAIQFRGKLVEKLDGHWIRLGPETQQPPGPATISTWINLNNVAVIGSASFETAPAPAPTVPR